MKHHFLLDENVLHFAIKCVDKHGNPDYSCAQLLLHIAANCHRIIVSPFLERRYAVHLQALNGDPSRVLQPAFVFSQLIHNSAKFVFQYQNPPHLPAGCRIPTEDVDVVRAALISRPNFVTGDDELRGAINECTALHLTALLPTEAIVLAQDS